MESKQRKSSAARIKANNKYNAKTYKTFTVNAKISDYEIIDNYCKANNISKAQLLLKSTMYCIDNNIDLSQGVPNAETLESLAEVREMKTNPSEYKSYTSIQELMDDLKTDD